MIYGSFVRRSVKLNTPAAAAMAAILPSDGRRVRLTALPPSLGTESDVSDRGRVTSKRWPSVVNDVHDVIVAVNQGRTRDCAGEDTRTHTRPRPQQCSEAMAIIVRRRCNDPVDNVGWPR